MEEEWNDRDRFIYKWLFMIKANMILQVFIIFWKWRTAILGESIKSDLSMDSTRWRMILWSRTKLSFSMKSTRTLKTNRIRSLWITYILLLNLSFNLNSTLSSRNRKMRSMKKPSIVTMLKQMIHQKRLNLLSSM